MIEEPVNKDVIGKYVVFYNGCFALRRDFRIVGINSGGTRISFDWDGEIQTEHIMHFETIVNNPGDSIK
jgi:hypothetical protein